MMKAVIYCEKIGLTYEEYLDQPEWLVELTFAKWNVDIENQKAANFSKQHGH